MRVNSNQAPLKIRVEKITTKAPVKCEIRLTENVIKLSDMDYMYDEYVFYDLFYDGIEQDILNRFDEWVLTGKSSEIKEYASEVYQMEQEHTRELANLIEMIYEDDLEVIG